MPTLRRHGYKGEVSVDMTGAGTTFVPVASLNGFTINMERELVPVQAFGDTVKLYVQGLPDLKGTLKGWWEATESRKLFDIMLGDVAVLLKLVPSTLDVEYFWSGMAYLSGGIEVNADGAITISGNYAAADEWTFDAPAPV